MNKRIEKVKELAAQLTELFPQTRLVALQVGRSGSIDLSLHGEETETYAGATDFMRELGVGDREKTVYPSYTCLSGSVDGVSVHTYPDELPPTCRKEKFIEKIPKTKTVETGEYIEVERERIVCGSEDK